MNKNVVDFLLIIVIYYRTISKESLSRVDKRLDKISVALCGLRPRYMALNLVARISLIFITIITSSNCDTSSREKILIFVTLLNIITSNEIEEIFLLSTRVNIDKLIA